MDEDVQNLAVVAGDPNQLQGRRVLIMGLGLLGGGVASARYAVSQGAREVVVTDLRSADILAPSLQKLEGLPIRYRLGGHENADFESADVVVRNPGVRLDSPYLAAAKAAGARIEMEITWFFRACRGQIAGVTGTRGKSTTTQLLHHIMSVAGMEPLLGGNLAGIETLSLLAEATPGRWVVLELGSWMLEGLDAIQQSPHLAIFTNLMPDHLNTYGSMEEYGEAKTSIYRYQTAKDTAIFNFDNAYSHRYGGEAPAGQVWYYSPAQRASFSRDEPLTVKRFAYAGAIHLRGQHNVDNVQAATLAADLLGIESETIQNAVATFSGLPHRLETVRELDGVTYVNDSTSTTPVAGIAALRSFERPIILIAGGNSKRLDFSEFAREVVERAKCIVLLAGDATEEFAETVRSVAVKSGRMNPIAGTFDSLQRAVEEARMAAAPGDVVLLSPGFTSFRLFLNEYDRGNQYRTVVQDLV